MNARTFLDTVAAKTRERRRRLDLTQKQLASMAGVSERLVRLIEAAEAPGIGVEKLAAVMAPLGLELSLEGDDCRDEIASTESTADYDEYERLLKQAVRSWGYGSRAGG